MRSAQKRARARSERGVEGLRRWRRRQLCMDFSIRLASFVVIMRLLTLCECAFASAVLLVPPALDCANRNAKLRIFGTPPRKFHSPRGEEGPLGHVKGFDTRLRQSRARQASPSSNPEKAFSGNVSQHKRLEVEEARIGDRIAHHRRIAASLAVPIGWHNGRATRLHET